VKKRTVGKLTLDHLRKYAGMLEADDIVTDKRAPIILPEYRGEHALARALDIL
jgi:hypothetical protein